MEDSVDQIGICKREVVNSSIRSTSTQIQIATNRLDNNVWVTGNQGEQGATPCHHAACDMNGRCLLARHLEPIPGNQKVIVKKKIIKRNINDYNGSRLATGYCQHANVSLATVSQINKSSKVTNLMLVTHTWRVQMPVHEKLCES
ncbi:UNVERIFIED_CONTAM: hypothetical protein FKN15_047269 [Acipenser sinensis]